VRKLLEEEGTTGRSDEEPPPCSPSKPTRFPGRQKPPQLRSVREVCAGLRTEFRPFSLFFAQNRPPVSARKIPFPGPRDGEAAPVSAPGTIQASGSLPRRPLSVQLPRCPTIARQRADLVGNGLDDGACHLPLSLLMRKRPAEPASASCDSPSHHPHTIYLDGRSGGNVWRNSPTARATGR